MQVVPLAKTHSTHLRRFRSSDPTLNAYLQDKALRCHREGCAKTYLCFDEDGQILLGYTTILADVVRIKSGPKKALGLVHDDHPYIPALKIACLAADKKAAGGVGTHLVKVSCGIALQAAETLGLRLLTVDAYGDSVGFYERLGFKHNQVPKDRGDKPSMRLDIRNNDLFG